MLLCLHLVGNDQGHTLYRVNQCCHGNHQGVPLGNDGNLALIQHLQTVREEERRERRVTYVSCRHVHKRMTNQPFLLTIGVWNSHTISFHCLSPFPLSPLLPKINNYRHMKRSLKCVYICNSQSLFVVRVWRKCLHLNYSPSYGEHVHMTTAQSRQRCHVTRATIYSTAARRCNPERQLDRGGRDGGEI